MVVFPADLGGHLGDDLVEGRVGGDGSVGGSPEQDEAESSGGASVSSRDQDATEPSEGLAPGEEGGEGVLGTAELPASAHRWWYGSRARSRARRSNRRMSRSRSGSRSGWSKKSSLT